MSAFEKAFYALWEALDDAVQADALLTAVEREHAHRLAERIRSSEKLRDYTDDHMGDCNMAADLIDPEVS